VLPVRRARRDWPDIRGHRVRRVPKAREGSPAQRDHRVCPDSKENRVCRARPGHPDRLVPWGRLALRDRRVSPVLPEQFFGSSFSNALPAGGVSRAAKRTSTPSTGPVPAGTGSIWMKAPSTASRPAAMQTVSLPGPSAPRSDGAAAGCSTVAAHELSRACRMDGRAWPLVPGVSGHGGRRRSECQGGSQQRRPSSWRGHERRGPEGYSLLFSIGVPLEGQDEAGNSARREKLLQAALLGLPKQNGGRLGTAMRRPRTAPSSA
jgi:hypothetical protein